MTRTKFIPVNHAIKLQYLTSGLLLGRFSFTRQRAYSIDFRLALTSANQSEAAKAPQTELDVQLLEKAGKSIA